MRKTASNKSIIVLLTMILVFGIIPINEGYVNAKATDEPIVYTIAHPGGGGSNRPSPPTLLNKFGITQNPVNNWRYAGCTPGYDWTPVSGWGGSEYAYFNFPKISDTLPPADDQWIVIGLQGLNEGWYRVKLSYAKSKSGAQADIYIMPQTDTLSDVPAEFTMDNHLWLVDFQGPDLEYGLSTDTKDFYVEGTVPDGEHYLVMKRAALTSSKHAYPKELIYNNRTFIFPQWQVQLGIINNTNRQSNPDFTVAPMRPPVANSETGAAKMTKYSVDTNGYVLCNTRNNDRINNTIKFFDWFYSDEASELLSWGKIGETYDTVNGKREFILSENEDIRNKYGLQTYGLGQRLNPEVVKAYYTSGTSEEMDFIIENTESKYNPAFWLAFNDEEQNIKQDIGTSIDTFVQSMISKFLLGQEPLSNWDSYVNTVKEMGVEELLGAYSSAYERVN